ncbi:hypothetical protein DUNSADRAFT_5533 [Dunaliella salina]|uniref:Encoded protein n=1 Tax=Dunaliella salina TaxID=3046 RepID=A0ABQ7FUA6_DUNSA|nr:hypothetical protein DUNSADRAFT_5533 [Dunaliella salina]|eukprot:KAF5825989.1 hypothetical protein DUNSADRAFT_5533 [Dunaliella salina]
MDVLSVRLPKHMSRLFVPSSLLQSAQWQPWADDADSIAAKLSGTVLFEQGRGWQLRPGPGQGRQSKPQPPQAHVRRTQEVLGRGITSPLQFAQGVAQSLQERGHESHQSVGSHQGGMEVVIIVPSLSSQIKWVKMGMFG